jgi:hypothetical protein
LGEKINTLKKNIETLLDASREIVVVVNADKTEYGSVSSPKCSIKSQFTDC